MKSLDLPFFAELEQAQTILVAGAGGGFDLFSGLPLFFGLRTAGKKVILANLSFSQLDGDLGRRLAPALVEITADSRITARYFPEFYLSTWFRSQGEEVPVYCFERTGFLPLRHAYQALIDHTRADALVLVDGGTDSLMRGDEAGLGTPEEDIVSIAAVDDLDVAAKYLVCLGFGVDSFHGVCHAHAFEAIAELTRQGAFLGALSLVREMPAVERYLAAVEGVVEAMPHHPSIVCASIVSAIEGQYGNFHRTERTQGSTLWINPIMAQYWCFRLGAVARRILYLDAVKKTRHFREVMAAIDAFRDNCPTIRGRSVIPDSSFDR
jgi:hypothetical protein